MIGVVGGDWVEGVNPAAAADDAEEHGGGLSPEPTAREVVDAAARRYRDVRRLASARRKSWKMSFRVCMCLLASILDIELNILKLFSSKSL